MVIHARYIRKSSTGIVWERKTLQAQRRARTKVEQTRRRHACAPYVLIAQFSFVRHRAGSATKPLFGFALKIMFVMICRPFLSFRTSSPPLYLLLFPHEYTHAQDAVPPYFSTAITTLCSYEALKTSWIKGEKPRSQNAGMEMWILYLLSVSACTL